VVFDRRLGNRRPGDRILHFFQPQVRAARRHIL
jgi:hypothetical protein